MLNGHFPFSFSHGTFYTHASHSSAASHWGFFVYLRMSLWPVEKVRVDKNLPYYLVQYAEPLHTPAAFLCQGWRSTGRPNPSPVYKAHCHKNVNCKLWLHPIKFWHLTFLSQNCDIVDIWRHHIFITKLSHFQIVT